MATKNRANEAHQLNKWLTTPLGSLIKVFIAPVLAILIGEYTTEGKITFDLCLLNTCLAAGVIAVLIVIQNWINPSYKNYGK